MTKIDLTGKVFGKLTVIEKAYSKNYKVYWKCKCECGNETFVCTSNLTKGHTTSCGCKARRSKNSYDPLVGQVFGRLTVLEEFKLFEKRKYRTYCRCKCECGNEAVVRRDSLKKGAIKSCGCLLKESASKLWLRDLTGKTFGSLTVISRSENGKHRRTRWLCKCKCGKTVTCDSSALTSGAKTHCGCQRKKIQKKIKTEMHNGSRTRLYRIWAQMRDRCSNPSSTSYQWYGAKGVEVCDEWREAFNPFRDWALSNGYAEGLSIDRMNPFGNYEPSNCRWITLSEQAYNKRNSERNKELLEKYNETHNE